MAYMWFELFSPNSAVLTTGQTGHWPPD